MYNMNRHRVVIMLVKDEKLSNAEHRDEFAETPLNKFLDIVFQMTLIFLSSPCCTKWCISPQNYDVIASL